MVQGDVRRGQDIARVELTWTEQTPDQSLWSLTNRGLVGKPGGGAGHNVVAVLEMPVVGLKVPVYAGASDLSCGQQINVYLSDDRWAVIHEDDDGPDMA